MIRFLIENGGGWFIAAGAAGVAFVAAALNSCAG